jgi:hypothetical protein
MFQLLVIGILTLLTLGFAPSCFQHLSALLLLVQLFLSEMAPLSATKVLSFMPS